MHKPKVFIAMATGILGGPGKGLEQFLRYGGLDGCQPLLIDYVTGKEKGITDFVKIMTATGATVCPLYQKKTFDPALFDQALTLVQDNDIEILQSHGYKSHLLCYLLHRKTGLPWIAFVHGWTLENLRIRAYTLLEHLLLFKASEVVAVAQSLRQRLFSPVAKRARVITNALAPQELVITESREQVRQKLGIASDALVVGLMGRLSPEKGHELFLQALAAARTQGANLHALLVGDGQEKEHLQNLVKKLQLEDFCTFTGHVRDTANYYQAMDIQVMPSTTEGMPNAALEGMYMGLPLIATSVGGIPEVVLHEETGILFPSGHVKALEAALLRLAQSPETCERMGKAGKARVEEHFNPHTRAQKILQLYKDILSSQT